MWITFLLVVGSSLLVISGFTWAARREVLDRARGIEALRPIGIARLDEPRMVAVHGRVDADAPLTDPVTDEPVAFYEARIARVDGKEDVLRALEGGEQLRLDEGGARAQVRLEGAEIAIEWQELEPSEGEPSPRMKALLKEEGLAVPAPDADSRYVIFHRAIPIGSELTVVGTPSFDRGSPLFEGNGALLIVTDAGLDALKTRERSEMRAMSLMLRIAVVVGIITIGVAGVLLALST